MSIPSSRVPFKCFSTNVEAGRFTRRAINAARSCFSRRSRFWTVFCAIHARSPERTCGLERCGVVVSDPRFSIPGHQAQSLLRSRAPGPSPKATACFHSLRAECACSISGRIESE